MLVFGQRLIDMPVMSLQVASKIAQTSRAIIDPRNFSILAYEVDGPLLNSKPSYLRVADVREMGGIGMIIDSADELVGPDDVIKLKEVLGFEFELNGKAVKDERGRKLGTVRNYTIDTDSFMIEQIAVRGGVFSSLASTEKMIHRSQITEVNDTTIIVKSAEVKLNNLKTEGDIHRTYNNPFRKTAKSTTQTLPPEN